MARDTWRARDGHVACLEPFRKVGARAALKVISLGVDRVGDRFELLARRVERLIRLDHLPRGATTTTQRAVLSAPSASATCRATCHGGAIVIGQIVICHVIVIRL